MSPKPDTIKDYSMYKKKTNDAYAFLANMNKGNIERAFLKAKEMLLNSEYIVEGFRLIHLPKDGTDKVVMDVKRLGEDDEFEHNTIFLPRRYNTEIFVKQLPIIYEMDELRVIYEGLINFGPTRESVKLNFVTKSSSTAMAGYKRAGENLDVNANVTSSSDVPPPKKRAMGNLTERN